MDTATQTIYTLVWITDGSIYSKLTSTLHIPGIQADWPDFKNQWLTLHTKQYTYNITNQPIILLPQHLNTFGNYKTMVWHHQWGIELDKYNTINYTYARTHTCTHARTHTSAVFSDISIHTGISRVGSLPSSFLFTSSEVSLSSISDKLNCKMTHTHTIGTTGCTHVF